MSTQTGTLVVGLQRVGSWRCLYGIVIILHVVILLISDLLNIVNSQSFQVTLPPSINDDTKLLNFHLLSMRRIKCREVRVEYRDAHLEVTILSGFCLILGKACILQIVFTFPSNCTCHTLMSIT